MPRPKAPKAESPYPPGWEPFLAAMNAHLDDDTPRLVFADWLQENGDEPRAQFIRLQCAAARGGEGAKEAESLLTEHRARWLVGMPKGVQSHPNGCVFRRGFITALTVLGKQWATTSAVDKNYDAAGRAIRQITALEELRFEQPWNTLVESPTLVGIRVLTLPSVGSGLIESLAKSPVLPSLIDLTLIAKSSNGVSQRSFRALFASKTFTQLRRLRVESKAVGNLVAAGLANPQFTGLEELRLRHVSLDAHGAEALAHSPATASLRVLDLLNNQIGDIGLRELLASPGLRKIEELDLGMCRLTPASAVALADWDGLESVRTLNLRGNNLQAADQDRIARSPHAKSLTFISVFSI